MPLGQVQRREFITLLGGAAAWPLTARAQQANGVRRIGVLMNLAPEDQLGQQRLEAFVGSLSRLGWSNGRNVNIKICWAAGETARFRCCASELVALAPDVILGASGSTVGPLLEETRTIPIIFAQTPDPVGAGYVASLAHPGGNVTGFTQFDFGIGAKWLELLIQVDPRITRVLVFRDHVDPSGVGQFGAIQTAAQSLRVEVSAAGSCDKEEVEHALAAFAHLTNGGLIVTASAWSGSSRTDYHSCSAA
jgi:putative ABC transport system substrate-binding protein